MRNPNIIHRRKETNGLLVLILLITASFLSSCTKDEEGGENNPTVYLPEITIQSPDSTNFIIGTGDEFLLSITATINAQSSTSLSTLQIMHDYNNTGFETVLDSSIATYGYLFMLNNYTCQANENEGHEDWKIIVHDNVGGADSIIITTEVVDLNPILSFKSGEYQPGMLYIDDDTTIETGQEFVFGVNAEAGSSENLSRILIERNFENVSTLTMLDSTINTASFNIDHTSFTYPNPGNEEIICTVWDQNNRISTISFTITTTPAPPNITTYEDILLGAQNSSIGISFATGNGTVYNLADAKDNASEIDLMYFYGATNLAILAAPDDIDAQMVYDDPTNGLGTWDVLNNTRFKATTLSSGEFNMITTLTQLIAIVVIPSAPDQTKISSLAIGQVLAFETWDGKYGILRVDNLTGATDGSIEITVKVQ